MVEVVEFSCQHQTTLSLSDVGAWRWWRATDAHLLSTTCLSTAVHQVFGVSFFFNRLSKTRGGARVLRETFLPLFSAAVCLWCMRLMHSMAAMMANKFGACVNARRKACVADLVDRGPHEFGTLIHVV